MMRRLCVALFFLVGCQREKSTFEISSWVISYEHQPLAMASLEGSRASFAALPLVALKAPLRFSIIEDSFVGASIKGEQGLGAAPLFAEARLERPVLGAAHGFVEAESERLFLPIQVLGQAISVSVDGAKASGALSQSQQISGHFTGFVSLSSAAGALEQLAVRLQRQVELDAQAYSGEPIPCDGDESRSSLLCQLNGVEGVCSEATLDGVAGGVCIGAESPSALALGLFDADGDGVLSVAFDRSSVRFTRNELSSLFDISPSGGAGGLFGDWFRSSGGGRGSLLLAFSFEAVAVR